MMFCQERLEKQPIIIFIVIICLVVGLKPRALYTLNIYVITE